MASAVDIDLPRQTRSIGLSSVPHFNSDSSRKRRKYANGGRHSIDGARHTSLAAEYDEEFKGVAATPLFSLNVSRRRAPESNTPTYSSAAAAAAAVQVDNYKPREERSWEDFHPDLDIEASLLVFNAQDVDGAKVDGTSNTTTVANGTGISPNDVSFTMATPVRVKRGPGRPPRRPETMLSGLGSPPGPRIVPTPAQNPKERLNLPKPSYRQKHTFKTFEEDSTQDSSHVDTKMAKAGFQESENFTRPEPKIIRHVENQADEFLLTRTPKKQTSSDSNLSPVGTIAQVEYDMDEQDEQWLEALNRGRKEQGAAPIRPGVFEITMTQIEKEWHTLEKRIPKPNPKPPQTQRPRSSSAAAVSGEPAGQGEEQDSKCAICDDGDCENTNAIVFCDGCDLAVHQECYGVPFIPEGQWLCRKCQFLGRGVPTCIFCPNSDGAFKLTHESKWAHLLCSIWIPEVSLGNLTFMEPIMEVAKVPRSRWKLHCYLCNQRMGACIQCSNKNCYQAFHVTCARRAKLYLRTKSAQGGPPILDNNILKAYCDKHVSAEWQREYNTARATLEAKFYYRRAMRGRRWADSQQSALSLISYQHQYEPSEATQSHDVASATSMTPAQKKKEQEARKNIWRLPSGAPIVPEIIFEAVESALQKFELKKRKEYVYEACKYWTLKREARRGAALLKRLQLHMDTFSSTEIARRDFAGMGAVGGPKLQRRIEFTEELCKDMEKIRQICSATQERERQKLADAQCLDESLDAVYFPLSTVLTPVLRKASQLDEGSYFANELARLDSKLRGLQYSSVASLVADLGNSFAKVLSQGVESLGIAEEDESVDTNYSTENHVIDRNELRKTAKLIVKAIQEPLQTAIQAEADLEGKISELEVQRIESHLQNSLETSIEEGLPNSKLQTARESASHGSEGSPSLTNGDSAKKHEKDHLATEFHEVSTPADTASVSPESRLDERSFASANGFSKQKTPDQANDIKESVSGLVEPVSMPTPPSSEKEKDTAGLSIGGVPWYLDAFAPDGTSLTDEALPTKETGQSTSDDPSEADEPEHKRPSTSSRESLAESKPVTTARKTGRNRKRSRN